MAESVTMNDHFDLFSMEADAFESDVHVLIREALNAALEHLSPKADADLASLENVMKTVTDDDYHEHLVDEISSNVPVPGTRNGSFGTSRWWRSRLGWPTRS